MLIIIARILRIDLTYDNPIRIEYWFTSGREKHSYTHFGEEHPHLMITYITNVFSSGFCDQSK